MATHTSKQARYLWLSIASEVAKRGGTIEIPNRVILELQKHDFFSAGTSTTIEFTLCPPDKEYRGLSTYTDEIFYFMGMIIRYLIFTSPEQKFQVNQDDLRKGNRQVIVKRLSNSLQVTSKESPLGELLSITIRNRIFVSKEDGFILIENGKFIKK